MKNRKGLTLIELICIIGLLSILMIILIPKLYTNNIILMNYSKQLCSDIRNIRFTKMVEGEQYQIRFNASYYYVLKGTKVIKKVSFNNNIKLNHNFIGNYIRFSHTGAPNRGGTIKIINNNNNDYTEITIVPASGRVLLKDEIFEGYR